MCFAALAPGFYQPSLRIHSPSCLLFQHTQIPAWVTVTCQCFSCCPCSYCIRELSRWNLRHEAFFLPESSAWNRVGYLLEGKGKRRLGEHADCRSALGSQHGHATDVSSQDSGPGSESYHRCGAGKSFFHRLRSSTVRRIRWRARKLCCSISKMLVPFC